MSFREFVEHGWVLCGIQPGSKGPRYKNWNTSAEGIRDPARAAGLAGAGLLHRWSGTCAIDIDDYGEARAWLADRGVDLDKLLTDAGAVRIVSGREGRAKLIYLLPNPLASVSVAPYQKDGKTFKALEFRCATADGLSVQDVLPPSIHPGTGRPYAWQYGDELTGSWRNPPPLPDELLALWEGTLIEDTAIAVLPSGAAMPEIEALLAIQDPNVAYDDWLRVGMAIHHETKGSRDGLLVWNKWSSKSPKYKGLDDLESHWASFKSDALNPITIGGLRREVVADPTAFPVVSAEFTPADEVEDTRPDAVINKLLSGLVLVAKQEKYLDLSHEVPRWSGDKLIRHAYCPQMPTVQTINAKGEPKFTKPDPVEFLQKSTVKKIVDAVGLHPGAKRYYREMGMDYVNMYHADKVELLKPKPHELEAFEFVWGRIIDPVMASWLLKFYAHALQKPGVKIQSAPLLFSEEQGTGKNTLMKLFPELLFGKRWVRGMSGNVLSGTFNDAIGETWWLYLEELRSGATKADRTHITNKIKSWVTDDTIEIHPKGMKPFDIVNRIQITATSNHSDALQLDNNDRRWAIGKLKGDSWSDREQTDVYAFLKGDRAPGVLRYIFSRVSIDGFRPTAKAPMSVAKKAMIRSGMGSWESKIVERMVAGETPFDRDVFAISTAYDHFREIQSKTQFLNVLRGKMLGCEQLRSTGGQRTWAWRNIQFWNGATQGQRERHMESGWRPLQAPATVPKHIAEMSAEGDDDSPDESFTDLLE